MKITGRSQAFISHLLISLILMGFILYCIFLHWFPGDFIKAGGVRGLLILLGLTMVVAPMLTLMVFNPHKKSRLLMLDMSVIGVIQLGFAAYAVGLVYMERPLVQLLADDGIHIHAHADFSTYDIQPSQIPDSDIKPGFFLLNYPADPESLGAMKFMGDFMGEPYDMVPARYIDPATVSEKNYNERIDFIFEHLDSSIRAAISALPERDSCLWLPAKSIHFDGYGCINKGKGLIELKEAG